MVRPMVRPMVAGALALGCLSACDAPPRPTEASLQQRTPQTTLVGSVTPSLHGSISNGMIRTDERIDAASAEITTARAAELAVAFAAKYGPYMRAVIERAAGVPIDFSRLQPLGRVFLAASPYEPLPARYSRAKARTVGAYYVVTLAQDGVPIVAVTVTALGSDIALDRGKLRMAPRRGNEFRMVPVGQNREFPMSPENAVRLASEQTGALARELPQLVAPAAGTFTAHYSRWRVVLDRQVRTLEGTETDTVYVDWTGRTEARSVLDTRPDTVSSSLAYDQSAFEQVGLASRPGLARHFVGITDNLRRIK